MTYTAIPRWSLSKHFRKVTLWISKYFFNEIYLLFVNLNKFNSSIILNLIHPVLWYYIMKSNIIGCNFLQWWLWEMRGKKDEKLFKINMATLTHSHEHNSLFFLTKTDCCITTPNSLSLSPHFLQSALSKIW